MKNNESFNLNYFYLKRAESEINEKLACVRFIVLKQAYNIVLEPCDGFFFQHTSSDVQKSSAATKSSWVRMSNSRAELVEDDTVRVEAVLFIRFRRLYLIDVV